MSCAMTESESPRLSRDLERLLAEEPFIRALARKLVEDPDDVVQEAYLSALQRPGTAWASPRHWLARVVGNAARDRWRTKRNREQREFDRHADARQFPAPDDWASWDERRSSILRAINNLPEEQREVVLLRYYDNLPPRHIARDLGIPVSTVWNRLRSGLAKLRRELEAEHGEDLRAVLLPLAGLPQAPATLTAASASSPQIGVLAISTLVKLTGLSIATVAALALWLRTERPSGLGKVVNRPAQDPVLDAHDDGQNKSAPLALEEPSERERLSPPTQAGIEATEEAPLTTVDAASEVGSLRIRVLYAGGGAAADVLLSLVYEGEDRSPLSRRWTRTDPNGWTTVEELPPGLLEVRPEGRLGSTRVEVIPERMAQAVLRLDPGTALRGEVVDSHGYGVPGAHVHLGYLGLARPVRKVAVADGNGRFELRDVMPQCLIGARASGFAASPLLVISSQVGSGEDHLRIVLDQVGGTVEGRVLDIAEAPSANAAVSVGAYERSFLTTTLPGGGAAVPPDAARTRTDSDGRFRLVGLEPGVHLVEVRAGDTGSWRGSCTVEANGVTPLEVQLFASARIAGTVRTESGAPLGGVRVRTGDYNSVLHQHTTTDAAGTFLMGGLPPGELVLEVDGGAHGRTTATLALEPGSIREWNPVLLEGLVLHGRVEQAGEGVGNVVVVAEAPAIPGFEAWEARTFADEDGSFKILECPPGRMLTLSLDVRRNAPPKLENVDPRLGEVVYRLPE